MLTVCGQCAAGCGMMVRVVDGLAVKTDGLPAHPSNKGKTCPRAQASLQVLYDPHRTKRPMRQVGEQRQIGLEVSCPAGEWS